MTVDSRIQREIEHGKFLSAAGAGEVWNWESPAGKVRWQRRVNLLSSNLREGDSVLELGCGTGYFTKELVKLNIHITAIDISPELIETAKSGIKAGNLVFEIQNAYQMSFAGNSFNAVVGSSVLHHLDIGKALGEIFRVLKPGGYAAFTEPNMMNPQIALQKNIPWLKKKLGDSPDETAFFRWVLKKLFTDAGFSRVSIKPFDFLHPAVPQKLIPAVSAVGRIAEHTPLIREIAGSLLISACK